MVMRWPGKIKPGTVSNHLSASWDVMATVADISGAPAPAGDGISFLPTLLNKGQRKHAMLYWEYPAHGGWQVVRMGDWKWVRSGLLRKNKKTELFNLKDDPQEKTNIIDKHPEIAAKIQKLANEARVPNEHFPMDALDR